MDKNTLMRIAIWAGVILGALIGILGGVIGTYFSVKNTKGPRERAFMVRSSIQCWIGVCLYVLAAWFVPRPYSYGLMAIYVIALVLAIRYWNRRQMAIRAEESNRAA
jgi:Ca2+/Na+ antiporter